MTQFLTAALSLIFVSSAYACNCGDGAKTTYLKNVSSREATIITSRDGTPLKASFWGTEQEAAPVAVPVAEAPVAPVPAPVTMSSDIETVKSYQLSFASNSTQPSLESLEQVPDIKRALASGEYNAVKIVGFADQTGSAAYNNKLSLTRAQEVQKLLQPAVTKKTALSTVGGGVRQADDLEAARIVEVQLVR